MSSLIGRTKCEYVYLRQGHVWHDDAVQGTRGVLGSFGLVATRVVLILEMLICAVALCSGLPGHRALGHADGGFGGGGSRFAPEVIASHAKGAGHDGEQDLRSYSGSAPQPIP